jgi:hypothetical protein
MPIIGQTTAVADSTVFDIDYVCREEFDIAPTYDIIDAWIFGFTYEKAAGVTDTSILVPTGPWR